jgi:hypothetical protein
MTPTLASTEQLTKTAETAVLAYRLTTEQAVVKAQAVIITDAVTYHDADAVLFSIRSAKKQVEAEIEKEVNEPLITPLYNVLEKLYEKRRKWMAVVHTPLEQAERVVKGKMAAWQAEERRKKDAQIAEQQRQARELQRQADLAKQQAEQAKTESARRLLRSEATLLEMQKEALQSQPIASASVKGAGSKVVVKKRWRVNDMRAFIEAVVDGQIPEICLQLNEEVMETYFQADRALFSMWPVEIYDETTVAGR